MVERITELLSSLPAPLAVTLAAMLPILELRGAIPFARVLDLTSGSAYLWSVVGNLVPVPFILWWIEPVTRWAESHWGWLHRLLERLFASTRRRHTTRFERLRDLALVTFVAIPLPVTGAWSGALAAFVFGIDRRRAFGLIALGVMIAGVIVLGVVYGTAAILGAR